MIDCMRTLCLRDAQMTDCNMKPSRILTNSLTPLDRTYSTLRKAMLNLLDINVVP